MAITGFRHTFLAVGQASFGQLFGGRLSASAHSATPLPPKGPLVEANNLTPRLAASGNP